MDGFTGTELEDVVFDANALRTSADQVHFNPATIGIIKCVMIEGVCVDVAIQLIV